MEQLFLTFDDDRKLVRKVHKYDSQLKRGWVYMYKKPIMEIVNEVPDFSTLKIFLAITAKQEYGPLVLCTVAQLAKDTGMTYNTAWKAFKWLENNGYVCKVTVDGIVGILLNPALGGCGRKSLATRKLYWSKYASSAPPAPRDTPADTSSEVSVVNASVDPVVAFPGLSEGDPTEEYVPETEPKIIKLLRKHGLWRDE